MIEIVITRYGPKPESYSCYYPRDILDHTSTTAGTKMYERHGKRQRKTVPHTAASRLIARDKMSLVTRDFGNRITQIRLVWVLDSAVAIHCHDGIDGSHRDPLHQVGSASTTSISYYLVLRVFTIVPWPTCCRISTLVGKSTKQLSQKKTVSSLFALVAIMIRPA